MTKDDVGYRNTKYPGPTTKKYGLVMIVFIKLANLLKNKSLTRRGAVRRLQARLGIYGFIRTTHILVGYRR